MMKKNIKICLLIFYSIIFFYGQSIALLVSSYTTNSFHLTPLSGTDFEQYSVVYDGPFFFFEQAGLNTGDVISGYFAYDHLTGAEGLIIEAGNCANQAYAFVANTLGDMGWTPFEYVIPRITIDSDHNPDKWWLAASLEFDPLTLTTGVFFLDDLRVEPIPEPAIILLFTCGLIVFLGFKKKFKI